MPEERIKIKGPSTRFYENVGITIRQEGKAKSLSFSLSSETPVERWYGTEVLSHEKGAVRLNRAKNGAMPLLFNHNIDDPIGMISGAYLKDGRMFVDADLFDTPRAAEVLKMIEGGLRNVSTQYRIYVIEEDKQHEVFMVTDWEPLEGSIVSIPADASVGIGRANEMEYEVRMIRQTPQAPSATTREAAMAGEDKGNAAVATADPIVVDDKHKINPVEAEKSRRRGIENLCKANKLADDTRDFWISSGASMDTVAEQMLGIMEERGREAPQSASKLGLTKKEVKRFNLCRAVDACGSQNMGLAPFEAECSREIAKKLGRLDTDRNKFFVPLEVQDRENRTPVEDLAYHLMKRDLTAGTGSAGGFLVETTNIGFIELLRNRSVVLAMGARRLTGLQGNVAIPKQTVAATPVWLSTEATAITESQQTFAQVALSPKTVGGYTEISRLLLLQSNPSAEGLVMADLAAIVAIAVDLAALNGSGAAGQPTGIINTAGIGGVTGTSIAYAGIVEFQTDVATGNALTASCGYVATPTVAGLLKQRVKFTSTASPIWDGQLLDANVDGYRGMASNQVPTGDLLFGDFGQLVQAEWGILELEVNPYANFQAGIVGVRAIYSVDFGVRIPAAFSLATSVT